MGSPLSLSEEELSLFLYQQSIGVLATVNREGTPHAAPVWLLFRGDEILIETGYSSRKAINLRANPVYALVAGLDVWGPSVVIRGTAEEVVDPGVCRAVRETMAIRFYGSSAHPSFKRMEAQFDNYRGASVFRLAVSGVVSWDYAKMLGDEWVLPWALAE